MDFIASTIGISSAQAWALVGAAIIAIGIGFMVKYAGRFLALGALAIIAVAFLREHASWTPSAQASQAPQATLTPQIAEITPAIAAQPASGPVAATPALSEDEREFIAGCTQRGDGDSADDCMNLYAEKRYLAEEAASDVVAASAPAVDQHTAYMGTCEAKGTPSYACEVYYRREHYND